MINEKHETTKEISQSSILFMVFGVICLIVAVFLFLSDFISMGMIFLSVMIFFFYVSLVGASKIHSRHTRELILQIHNKTWEDYCDCYDCLLKRQTKEER